MNNLNNKAIFNKSLKFDLTITLIFAVIGLIVKHFFINKSTRDGNSGPAVSTLWGYSLIAISVLVMMFITFALVNRLSNIENCTFFQFSKKLLLNSLAPFVLFSILLWVLTINVRYFKVINKTELPIEYIVAERLTSIFILIQVAIIFNYIYTMISETKYNTSSQCGIEYSQNSTIKVLNVISIYIGIVTSIFIVIMNTVLAYYITDG